MWLNLAAKLVPGMIKTGMSIASNRRKTKELESVAELKLAERMASGEVEFKRAVIESHKGDWKDELRKGRGPGENHARIKAARGPAR